MKKLLFACALIVAGAFAFAGASPASAMTAGPVTSISDIVTPGGTVETVGWRGRYGYRGGFCRRYPWRCRRGFYYGPRRFWGGPRYRYRRW